MEVGRQSRVQPSYFTLPPGDQNRSSPSQSPGREGPRPAAQGLRTRRPGPQLLVRKPHMWLTSAPHSTAGALLSRGL